MNICYIVRDDGACAYYRLGLPMSKISSLTEHKTYKIEKGDNADHIHEGIVGADVLVIARPVEPMMHELIRLAKTAGKKVVIDFDDDLWNVSPLSPHYREWGCQEIIIENNGEKIPLWIDGQNIDIKQNIAKMEDVKRSCELADMVTVTQPVIEGVYGQFGRCKSLPNCVDMDLWQRLPLKHNERDEFRLYWSGGMSHYEDWVLLKDAIPAIMDKYKHVKLVLMGSKFDGTLKGIPQERIEFHTWVKTPAYPYKTAILNPDLCIIPLADNEFNRSKSNIKWVEQAALQTCCVTSAVTPYIEAYNGHNGVFVNNDTDSWIEGVSQMIENPLVRWNMAAAANDTVKRHYDINTQYQQWVDAYQELLHGN